MLRATCTCLLAVLLVGAPARADEQVEDPDVVPYRDPSLYATLSALAPGAGQAALDHDERSTVFALGALASLPVAIGVVGIPFVEDESFEQGLGIAVYGVVAVLAAVDAYELAERLNVENGYELGPRSAVRRQGDRFVSISLLQRRF